METTPRVDRRRLVELDGIRGLLALRVLFFHFTARYDELFGHQGDPLLSMPRVSFGVELFFILSGFVILLTLSRTTSIWDFVAARFGRLYPAYWVAILLTFSIVSATSMWPEGQPGIRDFLLNFTMLQEFAGAQNVDGVYWSLQIELMFYALMTVLFVFKLIRHIELAVLGLLSLSIIDWFLLRSSFPSTVVGGGLNDILTLVLVGRRIEYFATGMMLYLCWKNGVTMTRLAIIAVALLATLLGDGMLAATVHAGLVAVIGIAATGKLAFLRSRPLLFFGYISYSLYLVHQYIGYVLLHEAEGRGINTNVAIIGSAVLMIGLATLLSIFVERPAYAFIKSHYKAFKTSRLPQAALANEGQVS
jgi:peptidoglycan/LPS O-acetylase OafA/YrhL